jgi:hypothetical protein
MNHSYRLQAFWQLEIPGVPGLYLISDGGIAFTLPPAMQRPISDGVCHCSHCTTPGAGAPMWDTLRVVQRVEHGETAWTVHWPDLNTR